MDDRHENPLIAQRIQKLEEFRTLGINPYPNDFRPTHTAAEIFQEHGEKTAEALQEMGGEFRVAGRVMARRAFGKATFVKIQDRSGQIQVLVQKNAVGADAYAWFRKVDVGDFLGAAGPLMRTRTGELTVEAREVRLLAKSLRPLPEKWHGLTDKETRYRQRYVDLIMNPQVRETFLRRSRLIQLVREFLVGRGFVEMETPMMQPIPGGATARPFVTHHNALDMTLYLRVAPELYLKRLVVGGFERVFEINRNFRNEGLSNQHNPEFTMVEFYQAYATYEDLMDLTEELFVHVAEVLNGSTRLVYQGEEIDLTPPWPRLTVREAVMQYAGLTEDEVDDPETLAAFARGRGLEVAGMPHGKVLAEVFEEVAEPHLVQPTFVTQYPVEVSPLSRRNEADPRFVDRFELYIARREIANAFSELNDPIDQLERFRQQAAQRAQGDEEAHRIDEDFVRALEYGMPPTAGEGIGIDRMVMLFTDSPSIRDVILFPHMRPEA
ncbi:MAG: lysine--tRNA ligase [Candidatus Dadabacteria bacterium]|nr:MAG: lysine--tRNA ligase [Candidatus Dadabacteria bacterium]